jgi:hypothetical protein
MIVTNYKYNQNLCGHYLAGETIPMKFIRPHTMRGYFSNAQVSGNISQIQRDSFPTGTNVPYSIVMGDKGALISSTTFTTGSSDFTITSLAKGLAAQSDITASGDIVTANLSLIIQLATELLGSCTLSAALVGKLEMAAALSASGDLSASLSLIAYCVSEIVGEGSVTGGLRGETGLSADISSSSTLSPENLAAAVWNSIAASFNTAGTMGAKMNSAASAGDPWATALPGSYLSTEAGGILAQIQSLVDELHKIQGLDAANPMTVTPTSRTSGSIDLTISGDGETETIVTRN